MGAASSATSENKLQLLYFTTAMHKLVTQLAHIYKILPLAQ